MAMDAYRRDQARMFQEMDDRRGLAEANERDAAKRQRLVEMGYDLDGLVKGFSYFRKAFPSATPDEFIDSLIKHGKRPGG